ncbi:phage portal protein [Streptomyces sp. SCA3-4]|uniref:phage portal protein n=1 Tax=Streptomyces sichuanensis TaxID=2871810 RepID=UPI001CE237B3|nr:phage portal protein [Streptomyces sichuanensis]MCA6090954.1 phage portal protein [Streptomyces sichuanensis]
MPAPALPSLSLSDAERDAVTLLSATATEDMWRLRTLDDYFTGLSRMANLGIAIPPALQSIRTVTGWPRIIVDALDERLDIDDVRCPRDQGAEDALNAIWDANDLAVESQLAHQDALVYGHSYLSVGVDDYGDPLVSVESPQHMSVDYDARTRTVRAALRLISAGSQRSATLYLPDQTVYLEGSGAGWTVADRKPHSLGVVPVIRLANRQRIADRRGSSEITEEVRALTDAACRTLLGQEIAREFFAAPQRYVLGASEGSFQGPDGTQRSAWETYIGRYLALERDEDGQVPQVGQFPAYDPGVYGRIVDTYARLVAGVTALPAHMLGYTTDNPASAEAIRSAEARLIKKAERRQRSFSGPWSRAMRLALQLTGATAPVPAVNVQWRDPSTPTVAAQADATTKLVAAGILPADSEITLERAGIDRAQRQRIAADRARSVGRDALDQIARTFTGDGRTGTADDRAAA